MSLVPLHKPVRAICDEKKLFPCTFESTQELWQSGGGLGIALYTQRHRTQSHVEHSQHMHTNVFNDGIVHKSLSVYLPHCSLEQK